MQKRRITEQKLKTLAGLDCCFIVEAVNTEFGYMAMISSDDVGLANHELRTSRGELRTFKTIDAIVSACERIGMKSYSLKIK